MRRWGCSCEPDSLQRLQRIMSKHKVAKHTYRNCMATEASSAVDLPGWNVPWSALFILLTVLPDAVSTVQILCLNNRLTAINHAVCLFWLLVAMSRCKHFASGSGTHSIFCFHSDVPSCTLHHYF
jgi:hypothetical protein